MGYMRDYHTGAMHQWVAPDQEQFRMELVSVSTTFNFFEEQKWLDGEIGKKYRYLS